MTHKRNGFSVVDVLVVLLVVGVTVGLLVAGVSHARAQGRKVESLDNLKQLALAAHLYHDANNNFPAGKDKNNFSAIAHLLPYIDEGNVSAKIDFTKPVDDKANAAARAIKLKLLINPRDPAPEGKFGPTNYLFCAGSKPALQDNDGIFYEGSQVDIPTITDGTSNTLMIGETLRGQAEDKEVTVRRQYVGLTTSHLKGIKDDIGADDFKEKKNLKTDRGSSWLDGRFLQATFTATLPPNAEAPDVDCGGQGGFSALRSLDGAIRVALCDGSVRTIKKKIDLKVWKALATRAGGEVVPPLE